MGIYENPELDESLDDADIELPARRPKSRSRSIVMFIISMLLLGGAGYFVYSATDGLDGVWESVRSSPWWMIVLIVIGPMGNHVSVALCLQSLQSRHGRVGIVEMYVLVGSAWLFNYMPMRPGLIGRIGYHKAVNKIRMRDSLESSIWSGILAGIANCVMVVVALVMMRFSEYGWSIALPLVPVLMMFAACPMMPTRRSRLIMRALAYRQIDVIVWLGRYWLAFTVLGLEMGVADIAIISAVSQLASLMPLTGSGIGFREWGVGLTASAGGHAMSTAIASDLINRAAETLVVVPVGLICTGLVARHWKKTNDAKCVDRGAADQLAKEDAGADAQDEDESGNASEQEPAIG